MVQARKHGIQDGFEGDDRHASTCKCEIEDYYGREKEEKEREQDGAQ